MWWNGLYGMNTMNLDEIVQFGRSWAYAADIKVSDGFKNYGYDRSERCYQLEGEGKRSGELNAPKRLKIEVMGTAGSPVWNPAFYIKKWNGEKPQVYVDGVLFKEAKVDLKYELEGTDLIVYLPMKNTKATSIEIRI